ncbi:hypothetical protein [Nostoc sp. CALU 546]|uniref:hypothetical protein n=1 Tax=Nostoc sp. CALU 546 TaxID=1867241 RepID=UPI003B67CDA9
MGKESQNRLKHFAALKSKYQATQYQDSSPASLLYLILRKLDLGIELLDLESNWLQEHELFETLEIIWLEQFRMGESKRLEAEFSHLKAKYKVANNWESSVDNFLYPILWKVDSENSLNDSEVKLLQENNLTQIVTIAQDIKRFAELKDKYQATKYQDSHPDSRLYRILKKLDTEASLNDNEYEWLLNNELFEAIEISEKQDSATRAKVTQLKSKYQASQHPDTSLSSQLYKILQKFDADEKLIDSEIDWLESQGLTETIALAEDLERKREFIALKVKYKAGQYEDLSPDNYLYTILKKLDSETHLNEQDINFLRQSQLPETTEIANDKYAFILKSKIVSGVIISDSEIDWLRNNEYEDIIILYQKKHFAALKRKYGLVDPSLPLEPFYAIMVKLEKKERLDPKFVFQLMEEGLLSNDREIALAYYRLEAEFYEQELGRTGHKWNIATASGYWRKANEPERALKLTNIDLNRVNDSNLKSAILVTRGAAFRDSHKLDDAEDCAKKAMEYQPDSHQPYTLMGAICYDRHDYEQGNYWFEQAIQRGAEIKDIDAEIKRVIRSTKNEEKQHKAAEYLLKKDSQRYAWAKSYL